jgi:ferredoxin
MKEVVDIKFERENREAVIAAGTYLYDAARRLGIEVECERMGASDFCAMQVLGGRELFSDLTKAEKEHLSEERLHNGERLACQAKILKAGEVVIMTKEKVKEEKQPEEEKREQYRKEFEEMPLEKKIASLLELEAIALGETISFVFNSPFKIFDKAMEVMAEFGLKIEKDAKDATRPSEHSGATAATENDTQSNGAETKKTAKKSTRKKTQDN